MKARTLTLLVAALATLAAAMSFLNRASTDNTADKAHPAMGKPALAVTTVQPHWQALPHRLEANGSVMAWQEASLGAEVGGLRLAEVRAEVGDPVKRGQILARFASDTAQAERLQAQAGLAEATAASREANANADRARSVQTSGILSAQQIDQYVNAESVALARQQSAKAALALADLRLKHTQVVASDDGVISMRSPQATLGAVVMQGQELYRLIRQNRLEWRAEVTSAELAHIHAGQVVMVQAASGGETQGKVRRVAPTVDAQTRTALVYVDLPAAAGKQGAFKPGMFASGQFALGTRKALTVPRQALVVRDGFNYVFVIDADKRVRQIKLQAGQVGQDVVEILGGLGAKAQLVASGAGFLNDGDLVSVVNNAALTPLQR